MGGINVGRRLAGGVLAGIVMWGSIGLIEMLVATLAGGWIYREAGTAPTGAV
jgi:hypothetical protein